MELFKHVANSEILSSAPLAERLRPHSLAEFIGQSKILSANKNLRGFIDSGETPSLVLWGPPGTGKSTLARIIGKTTIGEFIPLSAIETGAKELREIGEQARNRKAIYNKTTVVFIDEIHRLNKAQQDVLLPYVESGVYSLIGATTENPSFSLTGALLSRCRLIILERHSHNDLREIAHRAFSKLNLKLDEIISDEALNILCAGADGDARRFLNSLEEVISAYSAASCGEHQLVPSSGAQGVSKNSQAPCIDSLFDSNDQGPPRISWPLLPEDLSRLFGEQILSHARTGDDRHDLLSAFIKSIRGSDPDASIYYLARMIEAGEDPLLVSRRLMVLASEDIGNADPRALSVAVAGHQALSFIGLPEAAINLAQVVVYLACAPKSNSSYMALKKSQDLVKRTGRLSIPLALRNAATQVMKSLGYGSNYKYSHDSERGWISQNFLPATIQGTILYESKGRGFEKTMNEYIKWLKSSGTAES